ncbi:MAG: shikimate kinase [bacterium]|nr:shikimate kinase [bacterium]
MTGNVVLTGFMGTGKSEVGRLLAETLGLEWIDTDQLIESRHGPIMEIFASSGEEAFRDMERDVTAELADRTGLVISTGGRLMLDPDNADLLARRFRVFCLAACADEVFRRVSIQDGPERPLLAHHHPVQRIADLLSERAAGYAQFEQVDTDDRTVADVVAEIVRRLE